MSADASRGKRKKGGKGDSSQAKTTSLSTISLSSATDRKLITQAAVKRSLTAGTFVDTKFYAFSRKKKTGVVDKPMALYANSMVLRMSSKYFEGLLTGGYRESSLSPLDSPFPADHEDQIPDYGYFSDSDLDDDDDDLEETSSSYLDPGYVEKVDAATKETDQGSRDSVDETIFTMDELQPATGRRGKVVILPDIAFRTLRALLFYLYTGDISFAPLKSQKAGTASQSAVSAALDDQPPLCSPKSIYRIADKYGLNDLKQKAVADIQHKLSSKNILPELFSTITSTYEELCIAQVLYACSKDVYPSVAEGVPEWIAKFSTGELQHCENVVSALFRKMADTLTASYATPVPPPRTSPPKCSSCKRQLTQSIYCNSCGANTNVYT